MFACLLLNRSENLKRRDISTDKDNIIFIPNGKLFNYRSICQGSVLHIRMRINDLCVNTINPMQNLQAHNGDPEFIVENVTQMRLDSWVI